MTSQHFTAGGLPQRPAAPAIVLLTPKEAAGLLKVSTSWLASSHAGRWPPVHSVWPCHSLRRSSAVAVDEVPAAPVDQRALITGSSAFELYRGQDVHVQAGLKYLSQQRNNSPSQYINLHCDEPSRTQVRSIRTSISGQYYIDVFLN